MDVALLGLGLIGGSIARALAADRGSGERHRVTAWTPSGEGPRRALAAGVVDAVAGDPAGAMAGADLVVLAGPPLACADLLRRLGSDLRASLGPGATIPYVGGHPMAGRETSGFDASDGELFRDRPWVICEAVADGDPARVRALALACGARPVELDAEAHDRLVAAVSHLPLITSVALVEAVAGTAGGPSADWPEAAALAASGWRDTTRLARGDVTMGTEIAVTNAAAVAVRLRAYRDRIDEWIALLDGPGGPDADAVRARLAAARSRLEG